jgi:hypothetical protein
LGKILGRLVRLGLSCGSCGYGALAEEGLGLLKLSAGVEERVIATDWSGESGIMLIVI